MGGDKKGPFTRFKYDIQQNFRIQTENRSAVRGEIADSIQPLIDPEYSLDIRHKDQMV